MNLRINRWLFGFILIAILVVSFVYLFKFTQKSYLDFSDSAKYASISKNIINGQGYGNSFSFWSTDIFELTKQKLFDSPWVPPVMPFSIAGFFKVFGINDFAVVATSIFYFFFTLIFTYLLGKKLFNSKLIGILSVLAVGGSYDLIHYAINGASESPFIFELVAASYFVSLKKKWASVAVVLLLILMYFTRSQAFIYILGIVIFWLLLNLKPKKAIFCFIGIVLAGLLVDHFVLLPLNGKYYIYSILERGLGSGYNQSSTASDSLRGLAMVAPSFTQILKNIFYNLYNFYKNLPEIINPYFFTFFVVGLFLKSKNRDESNFKIASIFMVLVTLLVTAASIPFYRYIHPIIPLVYISGVGSLVSIISKSEMLNTKYKILASIFLILFFGVGQTTGKFMLDSRFEAKTHNNNKPPVYVELSKILKENTKIDDIVVTNLDTWGSWYGERKTVWFPINPGQLIDPSTGEIPFNAIYLTSYKIDDANYYMGKDWRMIFENPNDSSKWKCHGCDKISQEYVLKGSYKIDSIEDYEKEDASAILLIKR